METALTPTNITGAALIAQFSILIILAGGSAIQSFDTLYDVKTTPLILLLALASFGALFFSDEFSKIWRPLFGNANFSGIKWSTAIFIVFIANTAAVSILVDLTGGSMTSPFTPVYFMLPALAIFLREPAVRILIYLAVVIVLFSFNLRNFDRNTGRISVMQARAYWIVSIACFVLTTYIGYITRP